MKLCLCTCSVAAVVSDFFVTPWTVACQAPLSMRFSRQEYWNGLPFPFPGDLLNPGLYLASPALAGGFFCYQGSPMRLLATLRTLFTFCPLMSFFGPSFQTMLHLDAMSPLSPVACDSFSVFPCLSQLWPFLSILLSFIR